MSSQLPLAFTLHLWALRNMLMASVPIHLFTVLRLDHTLTHSVLPSAVWSATLHSPPVETFLEAQAGLPLDSCTPASDIVWHFLLWMRNQRPVLFLCLCSIILLPDRALEDDIFLLGISEIEQ